MVRQNDVWLSFLLIYLIILWNQPPACEIEEHLQYCEEDNLYLVTGCDSNSHHMVWGSTICNDWGGGGGLVGISKFFESRDSKSGQ
jgi:hypothetical protein